MGKLDNGHTEVMNRLSIAFNYEDEWPLRVGELIVNLSE